VVELTPRERLQPALLERLTDDDPDAVQETREQRVVSLKRLRNSVLRDVGWLLNATNMNCVQKLDGYPYVAHSVVNFGLPELAGRVASGIDVNDLERIIRQAIWDYEPRILKKSVKVTAVTTDDAMSHHNVLVFDIQGQLWAQPMPVQLYFRTALDLETGTVELSDYQAPPAA
jgi:type VI secretion system protein ImpF